MDYLDQLSADLAAALEVDTIEERPDLGELHLCVRPRGARKAELGSTDVGRAGQRLSIDRASGHLGPDPSIEYDWFQCAAFACVDRSESVLVAAPTSAGKTAVAQHAIRRCLASGSRCVYTAPIKARIARVRPRGTEALSNEKFGDFVREFGAQQVALLTGDVRAGNPATATVVVMTTEVLVSLLHNEAMLDEAGETSTSSGLMQSFSCAVFDEIHYIADLERGTAWEEAIVLLERHVQVIGLSATVPNFCELAGWIAQTRHAPCHGIFSRRRPVPLVHGVVTCPPVALVEVTTVGGRVKTMEYQEAVQGLPLPEAKSKEVVDRGQDLVTIVQAAWTLTNPKALLARHRKRCRAKLVLRPVGASSSSL